MSEKKKPLLLFVARQFPPLHLDCCTKHQWEKYCQPRHFPQYWGSRFRNLSIIYSTMKYCTWLISYKNSSFSNLLLFFPNLAQNTDGRTELYCGSCIRSVVHPTQGFQWKICCISLSPEREWVARTSVHHLCTNWCWSVGKRFRFRGRTSRKLSASWHSSYRKKHLR